MNSEALKPCPLCGGEVQFRKALWPSDGNTDAIIHAAGSACGLVAFDTDTTDESVIKAWNTRPPMRAAIREAAAKALSTSPPDLTGELAEALHHARTFISNRYSDLSPEKRSTIAHIERALAAFRHREAAARPGLDDAGARELLAWSFEESGRPDIAIDVRRGYRPGHGTPLWMNEALRAIQKASKGEGW